MTKVKNIFHYIYKSIVIPILLLFAFLVIVFGICFGDYLLNVRTGKESNPLLSTYIIISGSMIPNINVYDGIVDTRVKIDQLEVGDVITFTSTSSASEGAIVTHRIVGVINNETTGEIFYRTKGDNNFSSDSGLVSKKNLIGKVILVLPQIGRLQQFLLNKVVWIFLILIPCVGIIMYNCIKVIIKYKKQNKK